MTDRDDADPHHGQPRLGEPWVACQAGLDPTSHGNGFANVGALDRDSGTPLPPSGTIKFTQPGTYQFICLIHPFMHGTVVVR